VHGATAIAFTALAAIGARAQGRPAARDYVISDMLEEIFLHHLARFAVRLAMDDGYPVIYAGFYAYDETGHAFGPEDGYALHMLRHVDRTIERVAARRSTGLGGREYELVVLSDHGQIETEPFDRADGVEFGRHLADWLPDYEIDELKGSTIQPSSGRLAGHLALAYSGGLAHLYFTDLKGRLGKKELEARFPGLAGRIAGLDRVEFVMLRDGARDLRVTREGEGELKQARGLLARFDDPDVLARQLHRLNSFERSGDLIAFGRYQDGLEINFENQVGGHGSIGGEQRHPFFLSKRIWGLDTSHVEGAHQLHPLLVHLRDALLNARVNRSEPAPG